MKERIYKLSMFIVILLSGAFWFISAAFADVNPALVEKAKKEGKLILYDTVRRETVEFLAASFQKKFGIRVEPTRKSTGGIIQSLEAERRAGKVRCDVVGVGTASAFLVWIRQGLLQQYVPSAMSEIKPQFRPKGDFEKFVVPQFLNVQSTSFNTRQVKAAEAPKTWKDLLDPKWKGKIAFPDPRSASTSTIAIDVLRILYGWSFLEELAKMKLIIVGSGPAVAQTVVLGEATIGAPTNASEVFFLKGKGEPIDQVFPEDGTAGFFNYLGLTKDADHPAAGKLWIEWIISKEGQEEFARGGGYYPVRDDVSNMFKGHKINFMEADSIWLLDHATEQGKKFMSLVEQAR